MNLEDHQYRITFFRNVLFKIKDHSSVKNEEIKTANSEALIKKLFQWCYFHVSSNKILIPWIKKSLTKCRSSPPEVFLEKVVLKICSKFTGEHPYRSAISIKLQSNFIEIILLHGYVPVNWLHMFRAPFYKNIYLFDESAARCIHLFPQKDTSYAPLLPMGTVKYIHLAA